MKEQIIRIYDMERLKWLWILSIAGVLLVWTPLAIITSLNPSVVIPAFLLLAYGIFWFYYKVCSLKTTWQPDPEGFSITALKPVKRYPFEEVYERWEDITSYSLNRKTVGAGPLYSETYYFFEVLVTSGAVLEIYTLFRFSAAFKAFFRDFEETVRQKSPFLRQAVKNAS